MREKVAKKLSARLENVKLGYNPKCEDTSCDHKGCIQDEETGEWYKKIKIPYELEADELTAALLVEQLAQLKSIRAMVLFFTVIAVVSLVFSILAGIGARVSLLSFLR